ncbi:hypothetical protein [Streptomyces uncialis]|uniref:hypothetical protein n=1 Tax=Streptomyces uncialis TaxID=1048205 RepID=UPI0033D9764F
MNTKNMRLFAGPVGVAAGGVLLAVAGAATGWWIAWAVCAAATIAAVAYMVHIDR